MDALNPAAIAERLNQSFIQAVNALEASVNTILDAVKQAVDVVLADIRTAIQRLIDSVLAAIQTITVSLQSIVDEVEQLVFVDLLAQLRQVVDNLGMSFNQELDRVANAFSLMLRAIPV